MLSPHSGPAFQAKIVGIFFIKTMMNPFFPFLAIPTYIAFE